MKTYNKSKIMKEAHYWRRVLGYTMSDALSMAWRNAKREIAISNQAQQDTREYNKIKECQSKNTKVGNMNHLSNSLTDYYNRGSRAYYGD